MGGESVAQSFTHIIVDEVHERDKLSDFLLTVLKDMLERYRYTLSLNSSKDFHFTVSLLVMMQEVSKSEFYNKF
jgi:HrpA-like RNA helicase